MSDLENYLKRNEIVCNMLQPIMDKVSCKLNELLNNKEITELDKWHFYYKFETEELIVGGKSYKI